MFRCTGRLGAHELPLDPCTIITLISRIRKPEPWGSHPLVTGLFQAEHTVSGVVQLEFEPSAASKHSPNALKGFFSLPHSSPARPAHLRRCPQVPPPPQVSFTMGRSYPGGGPQIAFLTHHLMIPPSCMLTMTFTSSVKTGAVFVDLPLTLPSLPLHPLAAFPVGLTDGEAEAWVAEAPQGISGRSGATRPSLTPCPCVSPLAPDHKPSCHA